MITITEQKPKKLVVLGEAPKNNYYIVRETTCEEDCRVGDIVFPLGNGYSFVNLNKQTVSSVAIFGSRNYLTLVEPINIKQIEIESV